MRLSFQTIKQSVRNCFSRIIRKEDPIQVTSSTSKSANGLDTAKEIMISRLLTYMFDPTFGVGGYLQIPKTDSLEDFTKQFLPHGVRAIRIALNLESNASKDEVKQALQALKEELKKAGVLAEDVQSEELMLLGMPSGVTVEDVKNAERITDPQFAKLFGLNETATRDEIGLAIELVLGVLQRERYGLKPNASGQELADAMMRVNN